MIALKSLLFLFVAPGLYGIILPLWLFAGDWPMALGGVSLVAVPLWLAGGFVVLWSFGEFVVRGKGTPAPVDPPKELVVSGFYRYVRNPMYVGVMLMLFGHMVWFGTFGLVLYAAFFFTATHVFVTRYEEPTLRHRFGESYERYLNDVPRWLPRFGGR